MLSVRDERRSRSKSPGGRDRDRDRSRSHSRDTRAKSPPKQRRPSKYNDDSDSDLSDDRRYKEKKSSKKYYDESDDDRKRKSKSSKYRDESESEEDRRKDKRSTKSSRRDASVSEDDRRKDRSRKEKKRSDESESDRRSKKDKSSKKKSKDTESEDSEDDRRKSKSKKEADKSGRTPSFSQPQPQPQVPFAYPQYGPPGAFPPTAPVGYHDTRHMSFVGGDPRFAPPGAYIAPPAVPHPRAGSYSGPARYAEVEKYQYAQPPEAQINYKYNDSKPTEKQYVKAYDSKGQPIYVEAKPEYDRVRPEKKYVDDKYDRSEKKYNDDRYERREKKDTDDKYDRRDRKDDKYDRREKKDDRYGSPPEDLSKKLGRLSVGGALGAATLGVANHVSSNGAKPPGSPLLEAYKGTYQSMSPMPSALVLSKHKNDSDLSDLDLDSDDDNDSDDPNADLKRKIKKLEKEKAKVQNAKSRDKYEEITPRTRQTSTIEEIQPRARHGSMIEVREPDRRPRTESDAGAIVNARKKVAFYDATEDAKKIAAALEGTHRPPNIKPLIQILPGLSTDDLFALRAEYKNVAKIGGQGINIAKHIKMRVPGNMGKAAYATALGRWESEAYWANSWYQGGASRRELLIESLMGRTNSDIREIKNCFRDKRYGDDLEKCMKAELKADKFRTAILLALEERRMPESAALDVRLIKQDVQDLHRALTAPGGETAMMEIIVIRSDAHLREVLRIFERTYQINFARAMIEKSRNLVGETLAHVLNGALNRPMRDALLLHQAISETAPGKERAELLISRLVRLHWEPKHLERVKAQYEARYRIPVQVAIHREVLDNMKTEEGKQWAEFCIELVRSSSA